MSDVVPTDFEQLCAHYLSWNQADMSGKVPSDEKIEELIKALHSQSSSVFDVKAQAIVMILQLYFANQSHNRGA